jgi:DNA-binding response OmpR family regulator
MHSSRTPLILIVEEDPSLREITAFRLELLGYEVIAQESGELALKWLEERLPSIVIVDATLPGMSGIEFVNRLSNDLRTSEIPVMLISTTSDLEDVQKAFTAGVDEYLVIPYDPIVLEAKVERLTGATLAGSSF